MGPNADNEETLRALIENGMDVARFNFSHGDYEEQKARMDLLKRVRKEMHRPDRDSARYKRTGDPHRSTGKRREGTAQRRRGVYSHCDRDGRH